MMTPPKRKEEITVKHALVPDTTASGWEQTIYAFLAEKERRFGSMRTVQAYSRMLFQFFGAPGSKQVA